MTALHLHGTGTALGDPIEAGAAAAVLLTGKAHEGSESGGAQLALTAHKAATGHAEAAAGVVGLAGALIFLEAGALPPILHLRSASQACLPISCDSASRYNVQQCDLHLACVSIVTRHFHATLQCIRMWSSAGGLKHLVRCCDK